ncbi:protein LYK5-like [Actinidia eriantha]|uniref:protein LYK5-like n=1 Tax=Actinidia eriantha TaxID=165200 RepID=UPI00258AED38|nr:protein LYK5-like [Actinidia eriantha]
MGTDGSKDNGLHYLHSCTNPVYEHKDVKSSNVLVDRNLRAKIANFSLARTVAKGTNSSVTAYVAGTRNYLAPEYVEKGIVTPKVDVYAFGVEGREVLLSAAVGSIVEGEYAETELGMFVDPDLVDNGATAYALRVARLSLMCLLRDPEGRPSMAEVVSALLRIQVDLQNSESSSGEFPLERD